MKNRREFLKKSALALGAAGMFGSTTLALAENEERKDLVKGKSKKKEVLFQRSANWEKYYTKAQ
ncbi:twin-arginine translocation signal domain-containing protein [Campylobacter hepaticus]|uniref:Twin-arginine translocation signal domain-containing protein n=1 Tax=Campylobacter hepaticus TaxID=1813019 RepID=A0A424Z0X1_9BACT|nr:twin-arginine translocation signal domain-containing protein [Campylobacter hepaticus]AXP08875.1 twin-arginine translocation signal domain-containing protein [Campylobacter hepaticus]MCZ0771839.1 twin-arginine translocation signal domain-containing protein [Campylobacter hepaticus]MCZ0773294.1 twin-arginine translocation signal domain-containing protein [Campylobacter hepaticus]MCZ0774545.1 twin-arginine translocation signal domain-containing protein [Campylobacter hepaticus]MDX2323859.1 tw